MKDSIEELGSLCKIAADLERKWDRGGKEFLEKRIAGAEYSEIVRQYLKSVRRLEAALIDHLIYVNEEVARSAYIQKQQSDEQAQ